MVYVVGGAVRDYLLARRLDKTDLDLVVEQPALAVAKRVADRLGWAFFPLDSGRDVARIVFDPGSDVPLTCDIAGLRGGSIEVDLLARDFTVNALAFALHAADEVTLLDICGGQADLQTRTLRRVTAASLAEDPVRVLRAVRFRHQLNFTLEEETLLQVKRLAATVRLASAERIRDELWKTFATATAAQAVAELRTLGMLSHLLPEVTATVGVTQSEPHVDDVYTHTLKTVEQMALLREWLRGQSPLDEHGPSAWLGALEPWRTRLRQHYVEQLAVGRSRLDWMIWYALLHEVGKPTTRTLETVDPTTVNEIAAGSRARRVQFIGYEAASAALSASRLGRLRFSRNEIQFAETVCANHLRPQQLHAAFPGRPLSTRACFRYYRDISTRLPNQLLGVDTLLLGLAALRATYATEPPAWADYLAHTVQLVAYAFAEDGLQKTQGSPLLDGHTLMQQLNLQPGRHIGALLDYVHEAQAVGEAQTMDEALALASQWLDDPANFQCVTE